MKDFFIAHPKKALKRALGIRGITVKNAPPFPDLGIKGGAILMKVRFSKIKFQNIPKLDRFSAAGENFERLRRSKRPENAFPIHFLTQNAQNFQFSADFEIPVY